MKILNKIAHNMGKRSAKRQAEEEVIKKKIERGGFNIKPIEVHAYGGVKARGTSAIYSPKRKKLKGWQKNDKGQKIY